MRKLGWAVPVLLIVLSDKYHFMLLILTGVLDLGALGLGSPHCSSGLGCSERAEQQLT